MNAIQKRIRRIIEDAEEIHGELRNSTNRILGRQRLLLLLLCIVIAELTLIITLIYF